MKYEIAVLTLTLRNAGMQKIAKALKENQPVEITIPPDEVIKIDPACIRMFNGPYPGFSTLHLIMDDQELYNKIRTAKTKMIN
jgi:hypothetical protein